MRKVDISHFKANSHNLLRWVARGFLLASALGVIIASYYFYHPENSLLGIGLQPQIDQALFFGIPLLVIVGFAWMWPTAGGVVAITHGAYQIFQFWSFLEFPLTSIPVPLFYALYGIFLVGGILSLATDSRQKATASYPEPKIDRRMRWTARITTVATIVISIIVVTVIYPRYMTWVSMSILASIVAGIAWAWPAIGGMLIALFCFRLIPVIANCPDEIKTISLVLYVMFLVGGVLHLVTAFSKQRARLISGIKGGE